MKLSIHYTKASAYISLVVLFTGAIIYYFAINYIANSQLDRSLNEELAEVDEYVRTSQQPPRQFDLDEDHTVFTKTDQKSMPKRFFDTVYRNPRDAKIQAGRAVEDIIALDSTNYKVAITISRESTRYLVEIITIINLILICGLLIVLFITNKYMLNGLWKPFYITLNEIKNFNISEASQFKSNKNEVDEFNELNGAIYEMSTRIKSDYENLKHFTENASHEMMTPLAVVTTKLDTLIQDETLRPDQLSQITDIYKFINKSTRLNQSLLLLVKLDNNLIKDNESINLKALILEKTIQFQELIQTKEVTVHTSLINKEITANKYLLDILLNNLFSNAIRHNIKYGKLDIILTETQLIFKNTGNEIQFDKYLIFERFQKGKESQGTGLGLTLVKNICYYYGFEIHYHYTNYMHVFTIVLK